MYQSQPLSLNVLNSRVLSVYLSRVCVCLCVCACMCLNISYKVGGEEEYTTPYWVLTHFVGTVLLCYVAYKTVTACLDQV